jgi:tetratricopeptide (TPR) repeat protein
VVTFFLKRALAVAVLGSLGSLSMWCQEKKPEWKDRAEYDLYESILKEQNANTKLGLIQSWEQKYPSSEFKEARYQILIQTFQALQKGKEMMDTAKQLVADYPKNFFGLYMLNLLTISLNDNSPAALDTGEKAAKGLLAVMDETFDPSKKKAEVTEDAWKKERSNTEAIAYRTLGWVALQRNQFEEAEKNFSEALKHNADDAQASLWLGTAIARQKKLEKQSSALYQFARAASVEGPGALPPQAKEQVRASFEKNYINFHGDKAGIEDVMAKAKASALPPDGFKIPSKDEQMIAQEEELKKSNPQLAFWINFKRAVTGGGPGYFDTNVKGSAIPGGVDVNGTKIDKLKGTVVSASPEKRPKEIVVGISGPDMSEATLRFETALPAAPEKGTVLEFNGVPAEFTPDPFNVVFTVDPKDVTGLPKAAPTTKKAAPAKKAGAARKKG